MSKDWIAKAHLKKGALHAEMGVPHGTKIPLAALQRAAHAGGTLGKRASLAETLRKLGHR